MNPTHSNRQQITLLRKLFLFGCLLHYMPLSAEVQKSEIHVGENTTVEELLRLDSRAALDNARRQLFGAAPATTSAAISTELPVLVAIYGAGRNLSAELLIAGRTVIYHGSGKQSVSGIPHGYALERIAPPCVYLTKDQTQQIACLEMRTP